MLLKQKKNKSKVCKMNIENNGSYYAMLSHEILTQSFGFCLLHYVIYKALCFDVAQGRMNGAPNETRTHSCRSASLAC